jgi:hypothetical protein
VRQLEDAIDIAARNGVDLAGTRKALDSIRGELVDVEVTLTNELRRAAERAARTRPVRASLVVIPTTGHTVAGDVRAEDSLSRGRLSSPRSSASGLSRSRSLLSTGQAAPEALDEPDHDAFEGLG